jgi:uncharacterized membrane protein (UPF0136 family)
MKTIFENMLTAAAVVATACVVAISGYLFFANVGQKWVYGVAVATMAVAWFARRFGSSRRNVTMSLVVAGALLSAALGAKALEHMGWAGGSDIAARTNGIMEGAILVVFSNAIPKRMSSANALAMLRTVGRAFVIGGFGYACAWLVLPLRLADTVAPVIVLASIVVAAASYTGWHRSSDRSVS